VTGTCAADAFMAIFGLRRADDVIPDRTHPGDTGDAVRAWQAYLVRHGYPELRPDGAHGPRTEAASVAWDAAQQADAEGRATAAEDDVRPRIVALARSYVGVSCRTKEGRERYLELVAGPGDTDGEARRWLTAPRTSGCALTCRGLLRRAGLRHTLLEQRVRPGYPMSDLQTIARESGAWRYSPRDAPPREGDMAIIDRPNGGHAYTVVAVEPGPVCTLETVDGGASDGGAQAIAARRRTWTLGANWRIVDSRDGGGAYAVLGWVDVGALRW
jgi:hypothetical protein